MKISATSIIKKTEPSIKPIILTEEHKIKLIEMCNVLFSEYKSIELWGFNSYDDFCRLGGNEKIDNCIYFYPEKLPLNKKNPPRIDWDNVQKTNIPITIHWFEFCMMHLAPKIIYPLYISKDANSDEGGQLGMELFGNTILYHPKEHPVEYLYKQFLKLK